MTSPSCCLASSPPCVFPGSALGGTLATGAFSHLWAAFNPAWGHPADASVARRLLGHIPTSRLPTMIPIKTKPDKWAEAAKFQEWEGTSLCPRQTGTALGTIPPLGVGCSPGTVLCLSCSPSVGSYSIVRAGSERHQRCRCCLRVAGGWPGAPLGPHQGSGAGGTHPI